ncbi:hypothetical protein MAR_037927 [Mya arenaria]|uniref:VWFC domain-containing protein n=1 Tax=Mya arenaria TaxID=6604 RepID=A0ABY7FPW8_MYAAR|nr:hypothetical protein MAR_037927 [Mya arenaria]
MVLPDNSLISDPRICPDNRGAGERWNVAGSCIECYCDHGGYGCESCQDLTPIPGCYPVVDTTLVYPECCPRLVCPAINTQL